MKDVSIIIPTFHFADVAKQVLLSALQQTLSPKEIIIIDSSEDHSIRDLVSALESEIPINYQKVAQSFPGEARNLGVTFANYEWLACLDSKTIPRSDWLESNFETLEANNVDVVFGSTRYLADTGFQKALRASVFGMRDIETTPGSIIKKSHFDDMGGFREGVRTGDDMEWRQVIKRSSLSCITPKRTSLTYNELPKKLLPTLKRFFIYQLHGTRVDIQNTTKNIMLSFFLIFLTILIPKWNSIVGWEDSMLYFPNITKFYVSALSVLTIFALVAKRDWLIRNTNSILGFAIAISALIVSFFIVFSWNEVVAGWVEDSVWYFPHITKIYLSLAFSCSLIYRGIYFPLKNGITLAELLPFWWLKVGMLGLILDIAKAPGYVLGAILKIFSK
jgi:glycosyltransferase involved in cell wall biosynthesis